MVKVCFLRAVILLLVISSCIHGYKIFREKGRVRRESGAEDAAGSDSLVPQGYNPVIPPPLIKGKPTEIKFSMIVMNIRDVHDQEFNMEMNLRVHWIDPRLKNLTGNSSFLVLSPGLVEARIWKPDVFIDHVKGVSQAVLLSKPASIRLYENGYIRYSSRITISMSCQMNYKYYPADAQHCNVDLKSYAYTRDIVTLGWHEGKQAYLVDGLSLPNYDLSLHNRKPFFVNSTSGEYAGIRFTIGLRRKMAYHLLQTYLPSTLFLILSWMTFVMPQDLGAVAICMTAMLTITAMFAAVRNGHYTFLRQTAPNVSYPKAIDVWMVTCILFVFVALVQHMATMKFRHTKVKVVGKNKARKGSDERPSLFSRSSQGAAVYDGDDTVLAVAYRKSGTEKIEMHNTHPRISSYPLNIKKVREIRRNYRRKSVVANPNSEEKEAARILNDFYKVTANKTKRVLAMLNPLCFVIFNCIYWPWLLNPPANEHELENFMSN